MLLNLIQMQALEYCLYKMEPGCQLVFKQADTLMSGYFLSPDDKALLDKNTPNSRIGILEPYFCNLAWWQFYEQNEIFFLQNGTKILPNIFSELVSFILKMDNSGVHYPNELSDVTFLESNVRLRFLNVTLADTFEPVSVLAN